MTASQARYTNRHILKYRTARVETCSNFACAAGMRGRPRTPYYIVSPYNARALSLTCNRISRRSKYAASVRKCCTSSSTPATTSTIVQRIVKTTKRRIGQFCFPVLCARPSLESVENQFPHTVTSWIKCSGMKATTMRMSTNGPMRCSTFCTTLKATEGIQTAYIQPHLRVRLATYV